MVSAAVGRFSLSSSNVFSLGQPAELLFITPQLNKKLFQGRSTSAFEFNIIANLIIRKDNKLMMLMKLMISHVVESDDGAQPSLSFVHLLNSARRSAMMLFFFTFFFYLFIFPMFGGGGGYRMMGDG